jgi:hypothetical protein
MDQDSRIQTTSVVPSVARQTPKNDFGEVLMNTMSKATAMGGALVNGMSGMAFGAPVLSAAVSSVSSMAAASTASGVLPVTSQSPGASLNRTPSGGGDMWSLLQLQDMQSREFLALQNEMQRESREFNAISNVIKVRHDSAKAAINNIR